MQKLFYVFRYGQSSYNLAGRTQGRTNDSVLTPLGEEQARSVGEKLRDKKVEVILCSPLLRAKQTAELANAALGVPIIEDARFTEVDVGEIEGMHYTDIQAKFGEKYRQWRSLEPCFENVRFKGGESKKEVRERVFAGLEDYAAHSPYKVIAVSSHGIMLSQLLSALGHEAREIPNGTVVCIACRDGQWQFEAFL